MNTYTCWCPTDNRIPNETVKSANSFAARKVFAAKHRKQVTDCVARRQWDTPVRVFSDGTSIRNEP